MTTTPSLSSKWSRQFTKRAFSAFSSAKPASAQVRDKHRPTQQAQA
ncbi:hypothetical protein [Salidesulfovibrio onnuriiensis]|nr:hypothetical protein [Salidesulfovibrio onnuriiensis]